MKTYEMTDDRTEFERYQATFCNYGLLDQYRTETEKAMRNLGEPDFEIYKPALVDAYFPYSTRSAEQKADYNIAMFAVAQNEHNYQYVPQQLRTPEFVQTAFKLNPRIVRALPPEQAAKPEFVALIAKYKPDLLQGMGIHHNKEVAAAAVAANPSIYMQLKASMQSDMQIAFLAINKPKGSNIKDEFYRQNRDFAQNVLHLNIPNAQDKAKTMTATKPVQKAKGLGPTLKYNSRDDKDGKK